MLYEKCVATFRLQYLQSQPATQTVKYYSLGLMENEVLLGFGTVRNVLDFGKFCKWPEWEWSGFLSIESTQVDFTIPDRGFIPVS